MSGMAYRVPNTMGFSAEAQVVALCIG